MSVSQSNSTQTTENPAVLDERTRRTCVAPLTDVSMGKVTSCSTSSAAMPLASVMTTTVGAVKSGNTSTSVCRAVYVPPTSSSTEATSTRMRFCKEKCMILFSIRSMITKS